MHKFVFFNRQTLPVSGASLPAASSAALYGKGIFTTLAIKEGKASLWDKHWRRLNDNAKKIGVDLSDFAEDFLRGALDELVKKNEIVAAARARITFFDAGASRMWPFETGKKTALLITTADMAEKPELFRLTLSPFPVNSRSPLAGVKSCNYLEQVLALEEAKKRGFDEAVRLNERGEIASAATANIFWTSGEEIFTPALATGCLAGTTREFLMENHPVREKIASLEELARADGVFLTSAGIGIRRAHYENSQGRAGRAFHRLKEILDLSAI